MCGYDKAQEALTFHNITDEKQMALSKMMKYKWEKIEKALKNTTLLCDNCRRKLIFKKKNEINKLYKYYRERKEKAVQLKGGKCAICGYNECIASMVFHHYSEKDINMFTLLKCSDWEKIKKELDKTLLLCSNCHLEIHFNRNKR
jgi:hypothetical protein